MICNIISSSSAGNAVIYHSEILVDVGLSYAKLKPYLDDIIIVALTHKHGDHFSPATIVQIQRERPDILWITPFYLVAELEMLGIKNICPVQPNKKYKVGEYVFEPVYLYHDIPNTGYKITKANHKLLHATDTGKINHIEARNFDLYALEMNHDEIDINRRILEKLNNDMFSHEIRARDFHLSFQKAFAFFEAQKKEDSELVPLHISSHYTEGE